MGEARLEVDPTSEILRMWLSISCSMQSIYHLTAIANLRAFSVYNVHPAPLLSRCHLSGSFWHCGSRAGQDIYLPTGMRFGVDVIQ